MSECITSVGKVSAGSNGYARVYDRTKKQTVKAHRKVFESAFGEIPVGLVVMHSCDNRACTNLNHLKLGTQSQNLKDMYARGRQGNRNLPVQEKHHMTTLTVDKVNALRSIPYYRGLFFRWAKENNASRQTARNIYMNKTWINPNYQLADLSDLV